MVEEEIEQPTTHNSSMAALTEGTLVGGRYLIGEKIGFGGWSVVYKGQDQTLKRQVALKILHLPLALDAEKSKRFTAEATTASQLVHPNIATIYDFGVLASDQPFLSMEYLEGENLAERIKRSGRLSLEEALAIFTDVCDALQAAHDRSIVHRDIKPSNIYLCQQPNGQVRAKLLDFGLAKFFEGMDDISQITNTGETVGSPPYMSPEQCTGQKLDGRSDLYSLSCAIFEALTGQKAFAGNAFVCMQAHLNQQPPKASEIAPDSNFPSSLDSFFEKGLAKEPDTRFQTASELSDALKAVASGTFKSRQRSRVPTKLITAALSLFILLAGALALVQTDLIINREQKAQAVLTWLRTVNPASEKKLRAEIEKIQKQLTYSSEKYPGPAMIMGRFVGSQIPVEIAEGPPVIDSYFVVDVDIKNTKIGLAATGFEPILLDLPKVKSGQIIWIGDIPIKPITEKTAARLEGKLVLPAGFSCKDAVITVIPRMKDARNKISGPFYHSVGAVKTKPALDGSYECGNLSTIEYGILANIDGCWQDGSGVQKLNPSKTAQVTTIKLAKIPFLQVETKVAKIPDFRKSPLLAGIIRADTKIVYSRELKNTDLNVEMQLQPNYDANWNIDTSGNAFQVWFENCGEVRMHDLGVMPKLPDTIKDPTFLSFKDSMETDVLPGHCYLFRIPDLMRATGYDNSWIVFRIAKVDEQTIKTRKDLLKQPHAVPAI